MANRVRWGMGMGRVLLLCSAAAACGGGGAGAQPRDGGGTGGRGGSGGSGGPGDGAVADTLVDTQVDTPADTPAESSPGGGDAAMDVPGPRAVTLTSADALAFAAAQAGDGAWAVVAPDGSRNYVIQVDGDRYGFVYGCLAAAGDNMSLTVVHATVAETTHVTVACGGLPAQTPVTISGTVTGLTGTQTAQIDIASRGAQATVAMPSYSVMVPDGTWDLFARRITVAPMFDRVIRHPALAAGSVGTVPAVNLDFTAEGMAPDMRSVTFQGLAGSETAQVLVVFRNMSGGSPFAFGPFSGGSFLALPASGLGTNDIQSVTAAGSDIAAGTYRRVRRQSISPASFTATLPALPAPPVIAIGAATPYLRPSFDLPAGLDTDRYDVGFSQRETAAPMRTRAWTVNLTRGWRASSGAASYTLPDLSALAGFQSWWALAPAIEIQWQQFQNDSDHGIVSLLRADQTAAEIDGEQIRQTQRQGRTTL